VAQEQLPIPAEVKQRLDTWKLWWRVFISTHYTFGIGGVLSSSLAASLPKNLQIWPGVNVVSLFAVLSAVCFAVIGFVAPDKRYMGLIRAWRALDVSLARYRRGLLSEAELFDALERCETVTTEPSRHEPSRHELPLEKLDLQTNTRTNPRQ
jgi:hypothetical protein